MFPIGLGATLRLPDTAIPPGTQDLRRKSRDRSLMWGTDMRWLCGTCPTAEHLTYKGLLRLPEPKRHGYVVRAHGPKVFETELALVWPPGLRSRVAHRLPGTMAATPGADPAQCRQSAKKTLAATVSAPAPPGRLIVTPCKQESNSHNFGANANADEMRRWAQFAETVGYHFVLTGDHIALTPEVQATIRRHTTNPSPLWPGWPVRRRPFRLGFTVIVVPYRHPAQLAHMGATLDDLSDGRLIFGVGSGWAGSEFDALGIPFEARGRMTDEYLAAMIELWTNENASFDGEFVSFKGT